MRDGGTGAPGSLGGGGEGRGVLELPGPLGGWGTGVLKPLAPRGEGKRIGGD